MKKVKTKFSSGGRVFDTIFEDREKEGGIEGQPGRMHKASSIVAFQFWRPHAISSGQYLSILLAEGGTITVRLEAFDIQRRMDRSCGYQESM